MIEEPRLKRLERLSLDALDRLNEWLIFLTGIGLLVIAPYVLGRIILQLAQMISLARVQFVVVAVVVVVYFVGLAVWAWTISGDRGNRLFDQLYEHGIKWPFLFSVAMLVFALLPFSALSSLLADAGCSVFEPKVPQGEFWRLQDLLLWHFLDSVPALEIPETLHWAEPYKYKDLPTGVLLLIFKVVVIVPVIASFAMWNRVRRERAGS